MDVLTVINWWAVLLSTIVAMGIGSVWYSQMLFGKLWQKELKLSDKDLRKNNPVSAMFGATLLSFIQATTMAVLIGGGDVMDGLRLAGLVGVGLMAATVGVQYCFEGRSLRLFGVNTGYILLTTLAMGAVLGAWR